MRFFHFGFLLKDFWEKTSLSGGVFSFANKGENLNRKSDFFEWIFLQRAVRRCGNLQG